MDFAGFLRSILNQTIVRVFRRGVEQGVDHLTGGPEDRGRMTPEERAQAKAGRQAAKRMRQTSRFIRMFRR